MNTVLIIDDEEINYLINSKILKLGKFADKVVYHNSGDSALNYLSSLLNNNKEEWPTHIFIDINMDGMDGFQFVEEYKKIIDLPCSDTKLFILSSSINPRDKEKARELAVIKEYLTKPLTLEMASNVFAA